MANSWMQGMEQLSGKEGESILLSSRVTGNSIEPVIETFFISFLVSLLYNPSSVFCPDDAACFCSSQFCLIWRNMCYCWQGFFFIKQQPKSMILAWLLLQSGVDPIHLIIFFAFNSAFVFISPLTLSICKFCSSKFCSSMFVCSLSKTSCEIIQFNSMKFSKQIQQR